ncbi:glycosyltransferase family 2 protein [Cellulomonas sp. McL0617]|uniref:glycosyltransferase family 2 protein n=1 Tax=Cellulomonas sp. McL0617 TaxID=3415675 RepID=UPI003CED9952
MAQTMHQLLTTTQQTDRVTGAPPRAADNSASESPTLMLLVMLATAGVLLYAIFLLNPANRGDWLPWMMVIAAETVLVAQAILSMWTVLSSGHNPRNFAFHSAQENLYDLEAVRGAGTRAMPQRWPMRVDGRSATVDVFITTYGEDLDTIRTTATAALALHGEHLTYILDDGKSDEVRDLAAELGVRYVRRIGNNGAKAGNINYALSITGGTFFVIFDADFVPKPNFLYETVPFFANEDVAFVQTPQAYGNLNNLISRGAGYMQAVFYRFIQPGRNRFNAAFSVGTNVVFRRAAIEDIGGMYADSKSEDVWTSLKLHENGWRSVYIPTELAVGDTPETIEAYTKQQLRWATGGFEIMLTHNPLSPKHRLTLDQRVQYLVTATHYLTGIAPLLLLLVPPMSIFLNLSPMDMQVSPATWVLFYAGFYLMQVAVAFYTLGSFRPETLLLATVSFPIYCRALVNAVLKREQKWHVTGSKAKAASPFNFMIPQVLFFAFLTLTSVAGAWKDSSNGTFSLALAWNTTNALILGAFVVVAAREARRLKRAGSGATVTTGGHA